MVVYSEWVYRRNCIYAISYKGAIYTAKGINQLLLSATNCCIRV